jgi:hypothetical protein
MDTHYLRRSLRVIQPALLGLSLFLAFATARAQSLDQGVVTFSLTKQTTNGLSVSIKHPWKLQLFPLRYVKHQGAKKLLEGDYFWQDYDSNGYGRYSRTETIDGRTYLTFSMGPLASYHSSEAEIVAEDKLRFAFINEDGDEVEFELTFLPKESVCPVVFFCD